MYISNDNTQNYHFCRLQKVVETFGHSNHDTINQNVIEAPKVVKPTNKKML